MRRFLLLASLLTLATACRSTSDRLEVMVDETRRELSGEMLAGISNDFVRQQEGRIERIKGFAEKGELTTATDYYNASWILVASQKEADLSLARDFALKAVELGDERGFRIAATAIDKLNRIDGLPQRYGTQYEFNQFLGRWRLYPVDPATTDAERESMGIPPLRELYERERELNERMATEREG